AKINLHASAALTASVRLVDATPTVIDRGTDQYIGTSAKNASVSLSGDYSATAAGSVTFKVQLATDTGTASISNGTATNSGAIMWEVLQVDGSQTAPILVGSVVQDSGGVEKIIRVKYYTTAYGTTCTADPCGSSSSLSTVTVNKNATGDYTVNFPSGTYTAAPTCVVDPSNGGSNTIVAQPITLTTTAYNFKTYNSSSGSAIASFGDVLCMGTH